MDVKVNHSATGKHLRDVYSQRNKGLHEQFADLEKCRGKFESLIYETLFIQEKKPKLNTESDSIKAKLFFTLYVHFVEFLIACNKSFTCILHYLLEFENDERVMETPFEIIIPCEIPLLQKH